MSFKSDSIKELATALSKVQSEIKPAERGGSAKIPGQAERKYATITDVWEAVRKLMHDNGLSVAQGFEPGAENRPTIIWTLLMHVSGEWLRSELPMLLTKQDPQGVGSAITYYRRYMLAAMLGVTQDDDDAQSAQPGQRNGQDRQHQQHQQRPTPAPAPAPKPAATPAAAPTNQGGGAAGAPASQPVNGTGGEQPKGAITPVVDANKLALELTGRLQQAAGKPEEIKAAWAEVMKQQKNLDSKAMKALRDLWQELSSALAKA